MTLCVLPTAAGARTALGSGLTILHFGDLGEPDIAYVEHALGGVMMNKEGDVAKARLAFDRVRTDALGPAESLALIRRLARSR